MRIGWMPYLEIAYPPRGSKVLEVGKVRFLADSDEVWANEIKRQRPDHLQMFRDFPPVTSKEPGDPIRGTVVLCEDVEWLNNFLDEAVAIVYFLGDVPMPGQPAERFAYHRLHLKSGEHDSNELVSFATKHGELWETGDSIVVYPPLVVRGSLSQYRIDLNRKEHQKLLEIIKTDPHDRLVVAVRQYFRTQFSDVFSSTIQDDVSTHCSVVEAALGLDTRHMAGEKFIRALLDLYVASRPDEDSGDDTGFWNKLLGRLPACIRAWFKSTSVSTTDSTSIEAQFFRGLYVARSLHVHGATTKGAESGESNDDKAYRYFRSRRAKLSLLRVLSRDLLLRALGAVEDPFGFTSPDSAKSLLRTVLHSDELWSEARRILNQSKAADVILAMTPEQFAEISALAFDIKSHFDWQCVTIDVDEKHLFKAIVTCALVLTKVTVVTSEVNKDSVALGHAAHASDAKAVGTWALHHQDWAEAWVQSDDQTPVFQSLAVNLAKRFE